MCVSIDLDSRFVQFDHLHKNVYNDWYYWNYFNSCNFFFYLKIFCLLFVLWWLYNVLLFCVCLCFFSSSDCVSIFKWANVMGSLLLCVLLRLHIEQNDREFAFLSLLFRTWSGTTLCQQNEKVRKEEKNVTSIWLRLSMKFYSKIRHYKLL